MSTNNDSKDDPKPDPNAIINKVYRASTLSGIMLANSWIMKRFLKMKPVDLSRLDAEDIAKLIVTVFGSTWIRDYLVKQGIFPDNIITLGGTSTSAIT